MNLVFQNYHKHSYWTNPIMVDSPTSLEEYVDRIKDLKHKVLASGEHGWQGHYYNTYELAKKNDLKFIFSTEAYWVKNRFEKDNTNSHIILIAKSEKGRRSINRILSEANETGYYYRARLDLELLFSLPKDDVFITSACVAFWKYEDIDDIVMRLHNYFGDNFMLEVQYHWTDKQKKLNKHILELSKKHNIDIIMGCDSHYIYENQAQDRSDLLESKNVFYEDEDGWFMDYPSGEVAYERFLKQGILNEQEILRAIDNTNILLDFDDFEFNKNIKLPTLYPNKDQEWKDNLLKSIVAKQWEEYRKDIPKEKQDDYKKEIISEINTIINTKMTDYFLLDYEIVKKGIGKGGIISKTARGSGGSFFSNTLLGFSNLDRINAPVKLYPERFMSETRILLSASLPDLDLNLGTPDIFAQAQKELLGQGHSYPMIAFGTLKVKSAFKMYARAKDLSFEIANEISKQIEKYETDLKHAETEEDKELINLYDYVEEKYHTYLDESKKYQGIISDKKGHPCAYLIYQGNIREEIGLIKCKSETTKKEVITTVIDGMVTENYKFLKNDLLKVDVVNSIHKIYEKIGLKQHTINEIYEIIKKDKKTWEVYEKGYTLCINQFESNFATNCCRKYKPKSIEELTALVSALRPGFKSLLNHFLERKTYTTGVKKLDELLKDSFHFMMYQESIMTYLGWLGIPQTETYEIIKKVAKKKFKEKELKELKERLEKNWIANVGHIDGFKKTWQVVEDASRYSFNASHAYAYAFDSVYCAYLKANYPLEFYSVMLETYTNKGKKDKVMQLKKEMFEGYNIETNTLKFRQDNREFTVDYENKKINQSISSIKGIGNSVGEILYVLGKYKYKSFIELLETIKYVSIDNSQLKLLIKINYFEEFGKRHKLLEIFKYFDLLYGKKQFSKDKLGELKKFENILKDNGKETEKQYREINIEKVLQIICEMIPNNEINIKEIIKTEMEIFDDSSYKNKNFPIDITIISKYETNQWGTSFVTLYSINTGKSNRLKVDKTSLKEKPLKAFDLIKIVEILEKPKKRKIEGRWTVLDEKELILTKYGMVIE